MMEFLPRITSFTDNIVINNDTFNFLNLSGRKAYYAQGYYGQGVVCGLIDTGVRADHIEFLDDNGNSRVLQGKSFVPSTTSTNDDNGHGSHCAGSIIGRNCGMLPQAKLVPIKVLDGSADGTILQIIQGFEWAAQYRTSTGEPLDFISCSLSFPIDMIEDDEEQLARFHNAIKTLVANGTSIFVSAGNTGESPDARLPAAFDEVITVGAVDVKKNIASFSTRSKANDLCYVGVDVVSVDYKTKDGYVSFSGTSMATPSSAGIAGLLVCKYKALYHKHMPDMVLYEMAKLNTLDLGTAGIDKEYGAGFFTMDPNPVIRIIMTVGNKNYTVNGIAKTFDVPPQVVPPGRTLIPVRAISEVLGATVEWNDPVVTITR